MPAIQPSDGDVAVTGVSGFTGGWLVQELVDQGYSVRACLRNQQSWRGRSAAAFLSRLPGVKIVDNCDLFVDGSFDEAFRGCSAVFHVAAVLGNSAGNQPNASGDRDTDVYDGGVVGTRNILAAVAASGTVRRLVYTSSVAAIFHAEREEGYTWTESDWASDSLADLSPYAKSKVDTERMVNEAAAASGTWDVVTINPAHIVGPLLFDAQYGQVRSDGRRKSATQYHAPGSLAWSCVLGSCLSACMQRTVAKRDRYNL
jgi:nucleoside-diphosphate-sugar epimerase